MNFGPRSVLIAAALCLGVPLAATAQTFEATNRLNVVPLNATEFEVIEARGEGARGIWCAAADYAQRVLGMNRGGRMYVKGARGPSVSGLGRTGVVFTTDESRLDVPASQSISVSVRVVGQGLPIHHAYQFCKDYQIELEDILLRRRGE